ncbi:MAG: hypothetical protein M1331_03720 [Candidatus Marsarchaeota archaeon]|nr:hypothetical protein [Candidatus Marsarchaeota archaeon]MCL5106476.1 hypothetical protein [Candidatus Marsarchaeota archaeon]
MASIEILDDKENSRPSESFFGNIEKLTRPKATASKQQECKPEPELLRENLRNHEIEGLTEQYKKSEQELLRKSGSTKVPQQDQGIQSNESNEKA